MYFFKYRKVALFPNMITKYNKNLKSDITTDKNKNVQHIHHRQEYFLSKEKSPRLAANEYLLQMTDAIQIPKEQLGNLQKKVTFFDPQEQGVEYQFDEEKHFFDSTTISYYQTYLNVPVWRKGISVKIKQNPYRIIGSTNNREEGLEGKLPPTSIIENRKKTLNLLSSFKQGSLTINQQIKNTSFIRKALGIRTPRKTRSKQEHKIQTPQDIEVLNGRFFIYKYDPEKRYAGIANPPNQKKTKEGNLLETGEFVFIKIPHVSDKIKKGQSYLVAEIIFKYPLKHPDEIVWLALIEVETNSILYIEPMTCGINCRVFRLDPIVKTGNLANTSNQGNSVLNPLCDNVPLSALHSPFNGRQSLSGSYIVIRDIETPNINASTEPAGMDFNYDARTNNFAAVNAYYHQTELFKTIESLGFPLSIYFDGTRFPIPVDHRGMGEEINAHWSPNGRGGTDHMCYGLCDQTDPSNPLGRAVDPWVHWHEMGGHGTLGDHVERGNLGFAHSAGDGLAAIQMDPESALRNTPQRFRYAPFRPNMDRRFDRDVSTWAWGGPNDTGHNTILYGAEQILATCHFRIYRSIGGDHEDLSRRLFASRMVSYLILRTISNLTPATNPENAEIWCEEMQITDLENWTTEGLSGGAYNKVIRWAFEKQGCYQPAGTPTPVTTAGNPPEVDVYINDGRNGQYEFQAIHWENMSMWNRNNPDGIVGHQNAREGVINYMYVKVKNRGTSSAMDVNVKGFHNLPGASLIWPNDFTEMNPLGGLNAASIGANNSEEITVGPFEWVPNINVHGQDSVLFIVSTEGDPSNIDNFTDGETIEDWRLVPNDNNIEQRNVSIVP
jgi:zinc metalloprotease ZmpB